MERFRHLGDLLAYSAVGQLSSGVEKAMVPFLKRLSALALVLSLGGCMPPDPPYPNYAPPDTTGNYGAR